jgi:hypothetical protein
MTSHIYGKQYDPVMGWSAVEAIESQTVSAYGVSVAMDGDGNAIAVWAQNTDSGVRVFANQYTADTGWGAEAPIENQNGFVLSVEIAFDRNGNAIAVWQQDDGTRNNIHANRFDASTNSWGTAQKIENDDAGDAKYPRIAFDADGNALAVWQQDDGTRWNVLANRYDASTNSWGTAQRIETDDAGGASHPQIAFDATGNAIAVWHQSDGTRFNIWANRWIAP